MSKPILSLDFDGVIHSYTSKWVAPDIIPDPPVPGAIAFLREATEHFRVCVYSTRSEVEAGREAMRTYIGGWALAEWNGRRPVEYDYPPWFLKVEFPLKKPPALVGIDDRILTFEGEWPTMERLLTFKPWNKREAKTSPLTGVMEKSR